MSLLRHAVEYSPSHCSDRWLDKVTATSTTVSTRLCDTQASSTCTSSVMSLCRVFCLLDCHISSLGVDFFLQCKPSLGNRIKRAVSLSGTTCTRSSSLFVRMALLPKWEVFRVLSLIPRLSLAAHLSLIPCDMVSAVRALGNGTAIESPQLALSPSVLQTACSSLRADKGCERDI